MQESEEMGNGEMGNGERGDLGPVKSLSGFRFPVLDGFGKIPTR